MYSMPNADPRWSPRKYGVGKAHEEVRNSIQAVGETVRSALDDALLEAERLSADPDSSGDALRQSAARVARLTRAAMDGFGSLDAFDDATHNEARVGEVVAENNGSPGSIEHRGRSFAKKAAAGYFRARRKMLRAAHTVGRDEGFENALSVSPAEPESWQGAPAGRKPKTQGAFWKAVGDASLNLQAFGLQILMLPTLAAEAALRFMDDGVQTLVDARKTAETRVANEMAAIRSGMHDAMEIGLNKAQELKAAGHGALAVSAAGADWCMEAAGAAGEKMAESGKRLLSKLGAEAMDALGVVWEGLTRRGAVVLQAAGEIYTRERDARLMHEPDDGIDAVLDVADSLRQRRGAAAEPVASEPVRRAGP